ncbi:chromate transporter [Paracoccus sp. KR1-242]|uniref:chromate transporter n=1 Tax=Paracoccus sp. KR1-242 TaxID=3410028 RepID=UPI003C0347CE
MRDTRTDAAPVPAGALFLTCLKVGSLSFGGGLTGWLHREFVQRRGWVSDDDFSATLAIAQVLPGANVVNLVVCLGEELRGPLGAVACVTGFLLPPVLSVLGLALLFDRLGQFPAVEIAMLGIACAALGMLLQICWLGLKRAKGSPRRLAVIAAVVVGVTVLKLPMILVVLLVAPVSVWLVWRRG